MRVTVSEVEALKEVRVEELEYKDEISIQIPGLDRAIEVNNLQ